MEINQVYNIEQQEQNNQWLRLLALCTAFATVAALVSWLYLPAETSIQGRVQTLIISFIIIFILMFFWALRKKQKTFNPRLSISADAVEFSNKEKSLQMAFVDIKNGEIWLDAQNRMLNISLTGEAQRMDISGFENMAEIAEQLKSKTVVTAAVPSLIFIVARYVENPDTVVFPDKKMWSVLLNIGLGLYLILGKPSECLKYLNKNYKLYRMLEIFSGIFILLQGFRLLFKII